jgi:hypothetical protein
MEQPDRVQFRSRDAALFFVRVTAIGLRPAYVTMTGVPIERRAIRELGVELVVWDGDIGDAEITAFLVALAADPLWPSGRLNLTDLTTAGHIAALDRDLVADLIEGLSGIRIAVVALHGSAGATQFQRLVAPRGTELSVHADVSSACTWLGIDAAVCEQTLAALRRDLA